MSKRISLMVSPILLKAGEYPPADSFYNPNHPREYATNSRAYIETGTSSPEDALVVRDRTSTRPGSGSSTMENVQGRASK